MRVINLSYSVPKPRFTDPEKWLKRIAFSVTVMEAMAQLTEVHAIYHIDYRGRLLRNGVTYHFTRCGRWSLLIPLRFHRFVRRLAPDAIVVHGLISPWQVLLLRWQVGDGIRILIEHHAERPFTDFRAYLQRWADRYVRAYFFGSKELGRQWVDRLQIASMDKVKEIIGTASVFHPIEVVQARSKLGIGSGTTFIWVGRLDENKDPGTVVRAFSSLMDEGIAITLYMIYAMADATISQDEIIRSSKWVGERIFMIGEVSHAQLLFWFNSANFVVSSSHYEGSGIGVVEALSCGCYPILTDIPSFRTMTNHGEMGKHYPVGDHRALGSRILEVLKMDPARTRELVIRWYEERLSSRAAAGRILEVIENAK